MPNYCFNEITIKGPKSSIMRLIKLMRGNGTSEDGDLHKFDFNKAVPYPRMLEEYEKKLDKGKVKESKCMPMQSGYDWRIENWGTKWNSMESYRDLKHYKNGSSMAYYSFDTAWSPCVPVVQALAQRFPELKFRIHYKEEGMGFEETENFN